MAEKFHRFDEILDDCISRITFRGETVESCLVRYREHARELEPYLRTVARAFEAYSFTPSPTAKERARQRLHAERSALDRKISKESKGQPAWRWWNFGWLPRWAAAAVVAFLVVVVAGVGTAAASSNALPGEALYPVKRGAEQVWLSMQFSPESKAKLSLLYAQRRTDEMVALVKEGQIQHLAALRSDLQQNLETASSAIGSVSEGGDKADLTNQLQNSAVQSLNTLQAAAQQAPDSSRQAATDALEASSQAFGTAVEAATAQAPGPVITAAAPGILQVLASDPPPPNVDKVLVTVGQIEAYLSAGDNSRWIIISQDPQTFDLMRVADIQKFLAQKQVPPGTYTRVRFLITGAIVVAGGVERPAQVPSESLNLQRPFIVEEGKTTSVSLDFDGSRSLQIVGQDKFVMTPVVNVLVHRTYGEEEQKQAPALAQPQRQGQISQPTSGRLNRAEFEGLVDSVAAGQVVIRGVAIKLAPTTKIQGAITQGKKANIEATVQPDGSFLATKVEASGGGSSGEGGARGPEAKAVELTGVVQSISPNEWTVNGQKVHLNAKTELQGPAIVGSTVKVEGTAQADGSIVAGQITVIGGGKPANGNDGENQQRPGDSPIDISGTISQIGANGLTLDGKSIIITADTKIQGALVVGVGAEVKGQLQADGKIVATSIAVLARGESKGGDQGKGSDNGQGSAENQKQPEGQPPGTKTGASFTGTIEKIGPAQWTVAGTIVVIGPGTKVDGAPEVGLQAHIEGQQQSDGSVLASSIQVLGKSGKTESGPDQKATPPEGNGRDARGPAPPSSANVTGTIKTISPGQWTIDRATVMINADTRIDGTPAVGLTVQVTGQPRPDGTILASSIRVLSKSDTGLTPDQKSKPPGDQGGDKQGSSPGTISISGTIQKIGQGQLTVDGTTVVINADTKTDGVPAIGVKTQVTGQKQPDGRILATFIKVGPKAAATPESRDRKSDGTQNDANQSNQKD